MFQFRRFPSCTYLIQYRIISSSDTVFPHSEICGSKLICSSPQLIAACHVLLRLLMPRHPPCALCRLNSIVQTRELCKSFRILRNHILPILKVFHNYAFSSVALLALVIICYSVFKVRVELQKLTASFQRNNTVNSEELVGPSGLEPPTLRLSVVRSSQLSYGPISHSLEVVCPLN